MKHFVIGIALAAGAAAPVSELHPGCLRAVTPYQTGLDETGLAGWYGPGFDGECTASGELFDMQALTAAHRDLPLGSRVRVTNLENGRQVVVRINDRGPWVEDRIIDLSYAASRRLGMLEDGVVEVRLERLAVNN